MFGRSRSGRSARAFQAKAQWRALIAEDRLCEGASCLTGRCTRRAPHHRRRGRGRRVAAPAGERQVVRAPGRSAERHSFGWRLSLARASSAVEAGEVENSCDGEGRRANGGNAASAVSSHGGRKQAEGRSRSILRVCKRGWSIRPLTTRCSRRAPRERSEEVRETSVRAAPAAKRWSLGRQGLVAAVAATVCASMEEREGQAGAEVVEQPARVESKRSGARSSPTTGSAKVRAA